MSFTGLAALVAVRAYFGADASQEFAIFTETVTVWGVVTICTGDALSCLRAGTGEATPVAVRTYKVGVNTSQEFAIFTETYTIGGGVTICTGDALSCARSFTGLAA